MLLFSFINVKVNAAAVKSKAQIYTHISLNRNNNYYVMIKQLISMKEI